MEAAENRDAGAAARSAAAKFLSKKRWAGLDEDARRAATEKARKTLEKRPKRAKTAAARKAAQARWAKVRAEKKE